MIQRGRPAVSFLSDEAADAILEQSRIVLEERGVEIHHPGTLEALAASGAEVDRPARRARFGAALVNRALAAAPGSFSLFDVRGQPTHDFVDRRVHFTPGSTALLLVDGETGEARRPDTKDYVAYARLVSRLDEYPAQSTAFVPFDVPVAIADAYRLYLSLLVCGKPVITGAFSGGGLSLMRDLLLATRGTEAALRERPLAMFSCCPTSPLKWSEGACQNLVECARAGIPVEIVPMPLAGMSAAVTPFGALAQHAAEALSGVVIAQLASPGAPVMFGSSIAVFDVRSTTTPLGAIESIRLGCAAAELGRRLGLPTQAYMVLSDAKLLDAQCGLESAVGAVLAILAGINSVSGPGMHDFQGCFSLEKLLLDHEICRMARVLGEEMGPAGDLPVLPLVDELHREKNLVLSAHTRNRLPEAVTFPSAILDRGTRRRWEQTGRGSLARRAKQEMERLAAGYVAPDIPSAVTAELRGLMAAAARAKGLEQLPSGL